MARETGLHRRQGSRFWWIDVALPNGQRIRRSTKTEERKEAEALLSKLKLEAYRGSFFGIARKRAWQEAVVRYLAVKASLRSIEDVRRTFRKLDHYLGHLCLDQITGDVIWTVVQGELKRGRKPASVNRYLALIRCLLRMARDGSLALRRFDCCPAKSKGTAG